MAGGDDIPIELLNAGGMWLEVMTCHRTTQGRRNVAGGDDVSMELLKTGGMWLEVMTYQYNYSRQEECGWR